jgi:hypothetical protein
MPAIRTRPDTLPTGLLLACAGGFLDAYTFVGRGGVFANAQTGNIVLLGVEAPVSDMGIPLLRFPVPVLLRFARSLGPGDEVGAGGERVGVLGAQDPFLHR